MVLVLQEANLVMIVLPLIVIAQVFLPRYSIFALVHCMWSYLVMIIIILSAVIITAVIYFCHCVDNWQHILVGSALRRPHASQFSPLDYQSMPDVGRSPRQPYKSQTSCTVFAYAARPVSAKSEPAHLGRHTKSRCVHISRAWKVSPLVKQYYFTEIKLSA